MKLFEVKLEDDSVYVYVVAGDISKVKSIIDCKYRMSNIERIQHIKGEVIIEGV